jgi:hypothetical protein
VQKKQREAPSTHIKSLRLFHIPLDNDDLISRELLELGGRFGASNDRDDEGLFLRVLFYPFDVWGNEFEVRSELFGAG